jgi:CDP-diacylglycerol--glycerol-3-phosphate 3-phosphatidyltransferase
MTLDAYFARWQELHGGYDPRTGSAFVRGWLTLVYRLGAPLARLGVRPSAVTLSSLVVAGAVVLAADRGWLVAAALLVVLCGLLDNLDGCVAVLQDRTSASGYVLDSVVDRVTDSLFLVAAVLAGCPVELAAATGFGCFLLEYLRARAGNAGGDDVGRITVAERPTRILLLAPGLAVTPTWGTAALLAMTAVGLVQLGISVRTDLRDR